MSEWLWVGIGTTAALLAVGHWFPWPQGLRRIQSYIYGVTAILIGCTVWLGMEGQWLTLAGLVAICAAGGVVTCGAYWIDGMVVDLRNAKKAERDIKRRFPDGLD